MYVANTLSGMLRSHSRKKCQDNLIGTSFEKGINSGGLWLESKHKLGSARK